MSVFPTLPTLCFQNQNGYMYLPIFLKQLISLLYMEKRSSLLMGRNQNLRESSVNVISNFANCELGECQFFSFFTDSSLV